MQNVLLVEGDDDKSFHLSYCQLVGLDVDVRIMTPSEVQVDSGDGWSNLINNLPLLLKQLDSNIDRLGIILDADRPPDNHGGFLKRYELVTEKLKCAGFVIPSKSTSLQGDIFKHGDGLNPVGLWIMPNHSDDGMLEDFVQKMICGEQQVKLLNHAENAIATLPSVLFNKELHLAKAKILTWRAWQTRVGLPLNKALKDKILDRNKAQVFERWLKATFQP